MSSVSAGCLLGILLRRGLFRTNKKPDDTAKEIQIEFDLHCFT